MNVSYLNAYKLFFQFLCWFTPLSRNYGNGVGSGNSVRHPAKEYEHEKDEILNKQRETSNQYCIIGLTRSQNCCEGKVINTNYRTARIHLSLP